MFKNIGITFAFCAVVLAAQAQPAQAQSIVDIASDNPDFSALVDAVVAQDLADTLASEGTFTVFAPTNEAFANLPGYVGEALAKDSALLTDILLYHVVGDELFSDDVLATRNIDTLQGERIKVSTSDGDAFVNSSQLTALDIDADNGVIHVIDRVLLPTSVYQAVIANLQAEIVAIKAVIQDVRADRQGEKNPM